MKISTERLKQIIAEELTIGIGTLEPMGEPEMVDGETPKDPHGYQGRMAKQNLWKIAEYAQEMHDLIEDDESLEPWIQEKIAVASFMMDSVGHFLEYEKMRSSHDGEMGATKVIEVEPEENEEEFYFDPDEEGDEDHEDEEYNDEFEDDDEDDFEDDDEDDFEDDDEVDEED